MNKIDAEHRETYIKQSDKTFQDMNQAVFKHLDDRDWLELKPRGLATSIALEAAELLEHYQWKEEPVGSKQEIADELADIMIFCFEFALETRIDIAAAMEQKLAKAAKKYPAEQFKNKTEEEKRQNWLEAKRQHRENKQGL